MRDKLIELIQASAGGFAAYWAELIADHLIANGVTIQRWIPVSERPPEDGESVYAWVSSYGEIAWVDDGAWRSEYVNDYEDGEITNWMPLPMPPKGE